MESGFSRTRSGASEKTGQDRIEKNETGQAWMADDKTCACSACHADGLPLTTTANSIPITADDKAKPAIRVRHASPGGSYRADPDPDRSVITPPPGAAADKPGKRILRGARATREHH